MFNLIISAVEKQFNGAIYTKLNNKVLNILKWPKNEGYIFGRNGNRPFLIRFWPRTVVPKFLSWTVLLRSYLVLSFFGFGQFYHGYFWSWIFSSWTLFSRTFSPRFARCTVCTPGSCDTGRAAGRRQGARSFSAAAGAQTSATATGISLAGPPRRFCRVQCLPIVRWRRPAGSRPLGSGARGASPAVHRLLCPRHVDPVVFSVTGGNHRRKQDVFAGGVRLQKQVWQLCMFPWKNTSCVGSKLSKKLSSQHNSNALKYNIDEYKPAAQWVYFWCQKIILLSLLLVINIDGWKKGGRSTNNLNTFFK